jgi:transmembrane sensor
MDREQRDRPAAPDREGTYAHPDPVTDAALDWLLRLEGAAPDPVRDAALAAWLTADPRHRIAYDRLAALWQMDALRQAEREAAATELDLARPHTGGGMAPPRRRAWRGGAALAAALLLALGLAALPDLLLRLRADHLAERGTLRAVTLPDGSRMLLDGGSAVALDFAEGRRHVRLLAGEAHFDVLRDQTRPFRVVSTYGAVTVRGTAFAIRMDEGEDRVVLERGLVEVAGPDETGARLVLEPGRMVRASGAGLSAPLVVEPAALLAWREGRFRFENQPLGRVVETFRRHYRGTILVLGPRASVEVSGNYRLDDPVSALRSLAEIAGGSAVLLPGGIILVR